MFSQNFSFSESVLGPLRGFVWRRLTESFGLLLLGLVLFTLVALASWSVEDPSWSHATPYPVRNILGHHGAIVADVMMQMTGLACVAILVPLGVVGWKLIVYRSLSYPWLRFFLWFTGALAAAAGMATLPATRSWPLPTGLGGLIGDAVLAFPFSLYISSAGQERSSSAFLLFGVILGAIALLTLTASVSLWDRKSLRRSRELSPSVEEEMLQRRFENTLRKANENLDIQREVTENASRASLASFFSLNYWPLSGKKHKKELEFLSNHSDPLALGEREKSVLVPLGALIHIWLHIRSLCSRFWSRRLKGRNAFFLQKAEMSVEDRKNEKKYDILESGTSSAFDYPVSSSGSGVDDESSPEFWEGKANGHEDHAEKKISSEKRKEEVLPPHNLNFLSALPRLRKEKSAEALASEKREESERFGGPFSYTPSLDEAEEYIFPPLEMLAEPKKNSIQHISREVLEQNARALEGVLDDFGVKGEIIHVRPGPVVTLYELEPAPGIKSSRVIGLADDIARSMAAISARVAVVQGRNAIGVELPNQTRTMVYLRELLASSEFIQTVHKLPIALGKTIGGEPVIVDLARMPHLLVAGTTGSGKSVAINTMILSLLYRLNPQTCRLLMIDPKMLELSIYDGIPHLLAPVVTDPKKAVVALQWAVREMEDRYRKMSKLGVRNIDGFNARVVEAQMKGERLTYEVQKYEADSAEEFQIEDVEIDPTPLPYIVVVVDEMADLMMVAGKDIEGAIQRLAQMARAAGIHLIMATQRPSVDVITGTIKANFPTRISFQVTSKIDSRTILGEQGAEQLLGQGDMLYMAGGGRIARVHGPFVADREVEAIVAYLKAQGRPSYSKSIMDEFEGNEEQRLVSASYETDESKDYYDRALAIVLRDRKCSTSYLQRRLSIGYNKAASLVERMEKEGIVTPANHAGKREILLEDPHVPNEGFYASLD